MDYPQGKGRFNKQLAFLVRNLEYEYPEGRQSVMETLHLLIAKLGDTLLQEVVREVFWPLVSVMVNDESTNCREMASSLLQAAFLKADEDWTKSFVTLSKRIRNEGKGVQVRTALQCWTLYLEASKDKAKDSSFVLKKVAQLLAPADFDIEEWQLVYYALHTFRTISKYRSDDTFAPKAKPVWAAVQRHLSFPHLWVKQESAKLIGILFTDLTLASRDFLDSVPLVGSKDIAFSATEMCDLATKHLRLLRDGVTQDLASQAVRNLAFLGKCFAISGMNWQPTNRNEVPAEQDILLDAELVDDMEDKTAIAHLFESLAAILRREPAKARDLSQPLTRRADTLYPKSAAMQLMAVLSNAIPTSAIQDSSETVLLPLVHLTNPEVTAPSNSDASFKEAYDELVNNATELVDLLQKKLGTTEFVDTLQRVKKGIFERREEKRRKRKIEAVSMPEVVERRKARKREGEKIRRRERNLKERGKRRGW